MSKKIIGMIVAAVLLIAVVVTLVALNLSDWGKEANQEAKKIEINLEELSEKFSAMTPFNEMATMDIDSTVLTDLYQIDEELVANFIGKMPMMNVHSSMYLVIEATEGNVEAVKEKVDAYAEAYEATWEMYLQDQYELVKDRKTGVQGNFVYLFIGESAEDMEALMK